MSLHHTLDPVCPLCAEKAKDAHPILRMHWERVKAAFPDAHLSWTYRNEEMQELFFNEGKTRAHFPHSAHNKNPSLAMDLFQLRPDLVAAWPSAWFDSIAKWLKEQNAPIEWAGDWHSFKEKDHYQLKPEALV